MKRSLKKALGWRSPSPAKLVATYVVVGTLWVLVSDLVLLKRATGLLEFVYLNTAQQLLFVAVTAAILFPLIRRYSTETRTVLQRSAATAEAVLESAAQGIVVVDQHGLIVSANAQVE